VLPHFGDMPLDAMRQRDVAAWVARLTAHGLAPATVVKVYQLRARRAGGSRVGRLELHFGPPGGRAGRGRCGGRQLVSYRPGCQQSPDHVIRRGGPLSVP
jgi:hypothetical protein